MTRHVQVMLFVGAVCAAISTGLSLLLLFDLSEQHRWWIGATALSAGWIFAGVASGMWKWARTAVPSAVAVLYAYYYVVDLGVAAVGMVLMLAAVVTTGVHVYWQLCLRRTGPRTAS